MNKLAKTLIIISLTMSVACGAYTAFAADGYSDNSSVSSHSYMESLERAEKNKVADVTYDLTFDPSSYTEKTLSYNGQDVKFRAYENIVYVKHPAAKGSESMSIYVPEAYFNGGTVNGYTAKTAPIFMPNGVGGYMPGNIKAPGEKGMDGNPDASLVALTRGYVVAAPAIRGRTTVNDKGIYVGKAPALIVDYKAAVRYLRYNKDRLPAGNTERIISNGTSAGGALSALLGATGNSRDYEPYLKEIGAADERDDIYASMDYCPITNLDHADMAYEWMFNGVNDYHQAKMGMMPPIMNNGTAPAGDKAPAASSRPDNAPAETASTAVMTPLEQATSNNLAKEFPAYVNSLGLRDSKGNLLTLNEDGTGSFADYIKSVYMASAQSALDKGEDLSDADWLIVKNGKVVSMNLKKYAVWATRLKAAPAFDKLDLSSGENDEFANSLNEPKHFTAYSLEHSTDGKAMADSNTIKLMNPLYYIGQKGVTVAKYWRIRHGAKDRDTTIAVPAILALKLMDNGENVDFASPWGKGHAGDYDLDELFDWIDSICK